MSEANKNKAMEYGGFVDFPFSELRDIPQKEAEIQRLSRDAQVVIRNAKAVGQLVIAPANAGNELTVPTVKLRNRGFIDDLPLWQGTQSDLRHFYDQYTITAPTAVLIEPDKVLTAWHSIIPSEIRNTYFVFDRHHKSRHSRPQIGQRRVRARQDNWVKIESILKCGRSNPDEGNDWVILQLARSVAVPPIPLAPAGKSLGLVNPEIFILSHPLGLPLKYAVCQKLRDPARDGYQIYTDLGSGSSGAPILTVEDNTAYVRGIVNGGFVDFTEEHFVRTPTGIAIDPAGGLNQKPQPVTPVDNIHNPPAPCDVKATAE